MPKNIVSDTSCLILLEKIGELEVLNKLFGHLTISETVAEEYGLSLPGWINVKKLKNRKYQSLLQVTLDPGEASAIALAAELNGLLIIDDIKARRMASELQMDYTGTLGVLAEAKQKRHIQSFKTVLKRIKETNFYISPEVERKLLKIAGEQRG